MSIIGSQSFLSPSSTENDENFGTSGIAQTYFNQAKLRLQTMDDLKRDNSTKNFVQMKKVRRMVKEDDLISILNKLPAEITPWSLMDKLEFNELKLLCKYKGERVINYSKVGLCEKVYNYFTSGGFDNLGSFQNRVMSPEQMKTFLNTR